MTVLVLARHGETAWSLAGRHTGRTDLPLLPEGEAQARGLRGRLAALEIRQAYTSPLERARRTAELAGFADAIPTPLLAEYDYGEFEGLTRIEINARQPGWELFSDGCPGGESPAQVRARAAGFVEEALAGPQPAIAFAHGHILRAVACAFLGWDIRRAGQLALDTAGLSFLAESDRGRQLQSWNAG